MLQWERLDWPSCFRPVARTVREEAQAVRKDQLGVLFVGEGPFPWGLRAARQWGEGVREPVVGQALAVERLGAVGETSQEWGETM